MSQNIFDIAGKIAVITGASGVLGGSIAESFVKSGVKVVVLGRTKSHVDKRVEELKQLSNDVLGITANVLDIHELENANQLILSKWGRIDILVNCAGGNIAGATLQPDQSVFDMDLELWNEVVNLNLNGAVYPSLIFGKSMAQQGSGNIVNVSSMAALSAMTRVPGYSAAKAAVTNFTQWLAMEMAMKYGDNIRVNAIAPGFFIGNQNRAVLINPDGSLTERSRKILDKTPMKRFGDISELNGAVQFLCSDAARFITGAILPVDGGFSMFSGV
ncbi:MAG TPA: SDR family oxidoreductase [Dysgonamonadaceae bacterium]|jgi:NAD(P)-dependent dehydrogenase (short-subunit alcohol dehydrogenase family)|nr:SDR family oxidoreductase [Dysgonamonadaceae bacterium]HPD43965.1 SDR family oxidoreductase [Dysgonamonadaceae bacterium]HRS42103.1 SDR family oxidoreductase [Dysgonamonadaceae bacterium]HRU13249.1 SDR family oxidoreductase [Dysgonamonadaceae bacterium]